LYSQKLQLALSVLNKWGAGLIRPINSSSGVNMQISVKSWKTAAQLCSEARELGIITVPINTYTETPEEATATLIFYYNQIPLEKIEEALRELMEKWKA
jgi:DNA-binding transcriptional MocR family regulator